MSSATQNLGLFKYDIEQDANTPFSITTALNDNWDKIDTEILNKSQITNCILEAPNGVATYSDGTLTIHKGLKVLMPNGLNSDGTLSNTEYILPNDINITSFASDGSYYVTVSNSSGVNWAQGYYISNNNQDFKPSCIWYNPSTNLLYRTKSTDTSWGEPKTECIIMTINTTNFTINGIEQFEALNLLKMSDRHQITSWGFPSGKSVSLTIGKSGSSYTAPANGWFTIVMFISYAANVNKGVRVSTVGKNFSVGGLASSTVSGQEEVRLIIPVNKGDVIIIDYSYTSTYANPHFTFYYLNGEI